MIENRINLTSQDGSRLCGILATPHQPAKIGDWKNRGTLVLKQLAS